MKILFALLLISIPFISTSQSSDDVENRIKLEEIIAVIEKNKKETEELQSQKKTIQELQKRVDNSSKLNESMIRTYLSDMVIFANDEEEFNFSRAWTNIIYEIEDAEYRIREIPDIYEKQGRMFFGEVSMVLNLLADFSPDKLEYNFVDMGDFDYTDDSSVDFIKYQDVKATLTYQNITKNFVEEVEKLGLNISGHLAQIQTEIESKKADLSALIRERTSLQVGIEEGSEQDLWVFLSGFIIFIVFILSLFLTPLWFLFRKIDRKSKDIFPLFQSMYSSGMVTEIVTVFLLTSTILLLGITNKINSEILGTLIGGISGYVLGKSVKSKNVSDTKREEKDEEQ